MTHTTETLLAAVVPPSQQLQDDVTALGAASFTNPEATALEITSMTDDQRTEALFGMTLALGIAMQEKQLRDQADGASGGMHWTGPVGDEPPTPGYENLHHDALAAYADIVHMAILGNMAGVRAFFSTLSQPDVEQMLLSVIAETAVQAVTHGLHP